MSEIVELELLELRGAQHTDSWFFHCPGCDGGHSIAVRHHPGSSGPLWRLDESGPSFSPSLLVRGGGVCHSFLRRGMIEFLSDCTHRLAGKSVPFILKK